jgi:hypothetical protein
LTAVQEDLAQLSAIADYKPAQAAVATSQRAVTQAGAALLAAQSALNTDTRTQAAAQKQLNQANQQLANLAIAAYIGVGFPTAGAQPPSLGALAGSQASRPSTPRRCSRWWPTGPSRT